VRGIGGLGLANLLILNQSDQVILATVQNDEEYKKESRHMESLDPINEKSSYY